MLLLLCSLLALCYGAPPAGRFKSIPRPSAASSSVFSLNIDRAVRDSVAWYLRRRADLRRLLETAVESEEVEAALDELIGSFCSPAHFRGYIGVATAGALVTDLERLRELHRSKHHVPRYGRTFNELVRVGRPVREPGRSAYTFVAANFTAESEEYFVERDERECKEPGLTAVSGRHQSEWRVDYQGILCIAAFRDEPRLMIAPDSPPVELAPWASR